MAAFVGGDDPRYFAGGGADLSVPAVDSRDAGSADAAGRRGGGAWVLYRAARRIDDAELAAGNVAALCGVRVDCGVSVGAAACAGESGAAAHLQPGAEFGDGCL